MTDQTDIATQPLFEINLDTRNFRLEVEVGDAWDAGDNRMELFYSLDKLADLHQTVREAYLASLGFEERTVIAQDLQAGDVIYSVGATVHEAPTWTDTAQVCVHVLFKAGGGMTLAGDKLIRVNRPIQ